MNLDYFEYFIVQNRNVYGSIIKTKKYMLYEIINLIAENRTFAIAHNGELNPKFRVRSDTDQSTSVTI